MEKKRSIVLSVVLLLMMILPAWAAGGQEDGNTPYINDMVGILTETEVSSLEQRAEAIAEEYQFAVNIVVVQRYQDYNSANVYEAAKTIYTDWGLGYGSGHDGILLLLSMDERDYANIAYGYGNTAFTDYGKEKMDEQFLDDFRDDDWFDGFTDYLRVSRNYLDMAAKGTPFDTNTEPSMGRTLARLAIRVLVPLLIAVVYVLWLKAQMESVSEARDAEEYIDENSAHLRVKTDVFTHTTRTERKIERDNDRGGGGTSVDSGGFSGSSGKF